MDFLINNLEGKNKNNIKTLLKDGQVSVNGIVVSKYNHPLQAGQLVEILWQKKPASISYQGLSIIYEDVHLIVIDKFPGILSIAAEKGNQLTAYNMLSAHVKQQGGDRKIFVVHRLDRETSGVMMYAKRQVIQEQLQKQWHQVITERTYLAVVEGHPVNNKGTIQSYLKENKALQMYSTTDETDAQLAITHYQTMKSNKHFSLLKVNPETGRKNQIRVHMHDIGHPIVGDRKYGSTTNPMGRLGLHAWALAFVHPVTQKTLRFESIVPKKFAQLFTGS
jgi:23S rRNA pseudouridine1911/1915/1917 synthase